MSQNVLIERENKENAFLKEGMHMANIFSFH